jgi:hypothetical protein
MLRHIVRVPVRLGVAAALSGLLSSALTAQTIDSLEITYGPRGAERVTGAVVISEVFVDIDGKRALQRVLEFRGRPIGRRVDTIIDFWPAFEPHQFVSRGDFGLFDLQFTGRQVTGIIQDPAGDVAVDTLLTEPVVNASSLTAFLRTLPPRPGLEFAIKAYSPREGVFEYRGVIEGRETLTLLSGEDKEALRIVATGATTELTVWLDALTRRLIRLQIPLNGEVLAWAN